MAHLKKNVEGVAIRTAIVLIAIIASGCLSGCSNLPRDQDGWTARIQESRVLLVGVSREQDKPSDLERKERQLIEKIAKRLGARVEWRPGNAHELLQGLEELKLPLVAATVPSDTPFADRIGLSQPYLKDGPNHKDYCVAVAPGENRLLLLVDQVIAEERQKGDGK